MIIRWKEQSREEAEEFCRLHEEESGECLDPSKVTLYTNDESPYAGYDLLKIKIETHVIKRKFQTAKAPRRSISYVLRLSKSSSSREFKIVPLWRRQGLGEDNLCSVNELLQFRLNDRLLLKYVNLYGSIALEPQYHFFFHIDQLQALSESQRQKILNDIQGLVKIEDSGHFSVNTNQSEHRVFGRKYVINMPCLYDGELYLAACRVYQGEATVQPDLKPLETIGMFCEDDDSQYYNLDAHPDLQKMLQVLGKKNNMIPNIVSCVLDLDRLLMGLLPLFLFQLFLMLLFEPSPGIAVTYFNALRESSLLNVCCLLIGVTGVLAIILKYVYLRIIVQFSGHVPKLWEKAAIRWQSQAQSAINGYGLWTILILMALGYILKSIMALTLLLYGVSWLIDGASSLNFGQIFALVVSSIPGVGGFSERYFSRTPFAASVDQLPDAIGSILVGGANFLVATVAVGILVQFFKFRSTKK